MTVSSKIPQHIYADKQLEFDANTSPALTLSGVSAGYNSKPAIKDIDLTFYKGERVAVVGPNGAGKSTLFKVLVGLLPLTHGVVGLGSDGNPQLKARRRAIGYLQQRVDVDWRFPANVFDVVMMGRLNHIGWFHWPTGHDKDVVRNVLNTVGMLNHRGLQIGDLSGGQQRRVLIARALAQEASILLLDEPFAGVDTSATDEIFRVLDKLRDEDITVLVAIHDLNLARTHFDRVLLINERAIAYGPPISALVPEAIGKAYGVTLADRVQSDHILYLSHNDCCD